MRVMIIAAAIIVLATLSGEASALAKDRNRDTRQRHPASRALTPKQLRAAAEAEAMVDRLDAQLDVTDAEQLACDGEWRFAGSAGHPAYTLLIRKLSYTVQPDHGAASSGSVEASDEATALLTSNDPLARTGVEQHFVERRGTQAVAAVGTTMTSCSNALHLKSAQAKP